MILKRKFFYKSIEIESRIYASIFLRHIYSDIPLLSFALNRNSIFYKIAI